MALPFIPLAASGFMAVTLLQSGLDKLFDRAGNLAYLTDHFERSPLRSGVVPMFVAVTILEIVAGALCAAGIVVALLGAGSRIITWGLELSAIDLLCLLFGQRLSKDYGGAAVLTGYFAVVLLGLAFIQ
ncbi:MAG: DoxX family membrane protein [Chloroflexi bacterium]|nr:DoxX family membrane protein [Chloroflexota bacterium]